MEVKNSLERFITRFQQAKNWKQEQVNGHYPVQKIKRKMIRKNIANT